MMVEINAERTPDTSILIVGLGFVGMACFAGFHALGEDVFGIDVDAEKVSDILSGQCVSVEPDIQDRLSQIPDLSQRLKSDLSHKFKTEHITVLICVGTPEDETGAADLSYIKSAITMMADKLSEHQLEFVIKSTVPPGTIATQIRPLVRTQNRHQDRRVVSNPEFLREGTAFDDFMNPDRIIVGDDGDGKSQIEAVYARHFDCIVSTNSKTAEFSKYYSNTALAVMISFANEMRQFADHAGDIDCQLAFGQFQMDRRWRDNKMSSYFWPGPGFGGYCLPKDTRALNNLMTATGFHGPVLKALIDTNDSLITAYSEKILSKFRAHDRIVFMGSSFKVGSDDLRNSKTEELLNELAHKAPFEISLLQDEAADILAEQYENVAVLDKDHITDKDGVVVMLKDPDYKAILSTIPQENILNIPIV